MEKSQPPVVLVKSWNSLLKKNKDLEAKERGKNMLIGAFVDMKTVAAYLKEHNIV